MIHEEFSPSRKVFRCPARLSTRESPRLRRILPGRRQRVLDLAFSTEDLAHTRFAFSPAWEVVASVRVLNSPGQHALHLPWIKRATAALAEAGLDIGLLRDLVPLRHLPGFLAGTPSTPLPELADELADLRDVPGRLVRRELDAMAGPRSPA